MKRPEPVKDSQTVATPESLIMTLSSQDSS